MGQPEEEANAEPFRPSSFSGTTRRGLLVEGGILSALTAFSGAWYLKGDGAISQWNISFMICSVLVPYLVPLLVANGSGTLKLLNQKSTPSTEGQGQKKDVAVTENEEDNDNDSLTVDQEQDKQSSTPSRSRSSRKEGSHAAPPSHVQPTTPTTTQRTVSANSNVATYVNGRIMYGDNSPAHIPAGHTATELPLNFVEFCHGNRKQAQKQWQKHQAWRKERNVWNIHTKPDPCFDAIKKAYPHVCHGRSKQGWAVMYEHPGGMDVKRMFHSDITNEDILRHDVFVLEYVANVLHPKIVQSTPTVDSDNNNEEPQPWGMMGVLDLSNSKLSDFFSRDVINYLTMISKVNDAHYPLHVKKLLMINAPYWMAQFFRVIRPVLPKTLAIEVLGSKEYVDALREYIDDDELAQEFGGSSPYKLGEHPYELDLVKLATEGTDPTSDEDLHDTIIGNVDNQSSNNNNNMEEKPETTPTTELSRESSTDNDTTKTVDSGETTTSSNGAKFFWPVRLPSLCSTILSNSSQEGSEREDDEDDITMTDNSSTNEDNNNSSSNRSVRKSFLRSGPLRPRLPSFEPVLSPDEGERVMATLYNRNRAATETSYSEEDGDSSFATGDEDDKDRLDSFLGCDTLWSSVLSTCG